jgi:MoaA/NifB/PqqE/SkfB family radical SAM enzyme
MISYESRKSIEKAVRSVPGPIRDYAIETINPMRIELLKKALSPKWVTLFITNYCNARCDHCFYWSELNSKQPEMSVAQLEKVFRSLKSELNTLRLSGGEPFLRKDLVDFFGIIDHHRIAKKVAIPTHGMMEIMPAVRRMVDESTYTHLNVSVSLDGMEARHNGFRKIRNGFAKAISNLREMVSLGEQHARFNVSVGISLARDLVLPKNGKIELVELVEFLQNDVGVTDIGFDHIRAAETDVYNLPAAISSGFGPPPDIGKDPENWHKRNSDVQLDVDEMDQVNQMLASLVTGPAARLTLKRLQIQVRIKQSQRRLVDCLAGFVDCVIYPTGDVAVCEFSKPFANLRGFDFNLYALLQSQAADRMRAATRRCSCTHPCHLSDSLAYDSNFLKFYLSNDPISVTEAHVLGS